VEPSLRVEGDKIARLREDFTEVPNIPSLVYYCRRNPGEPHISPKAGNMNSVLFPEDPVDEDILNGARFVVINDARHAFEPEYLQRVVPYFFELKKVKGKKSVGGVSFLFPFMKMNLTSSSLPPSFPPSLPPSLFPKVDGKFKYVTAPRIAFCQVPQRFRDRGDGDPFGNRSAVMFDVTNIGRDGVGGVMSCGQGSIWRVDVLRDGVTSDGKRGVDAMEVRSFSSALVWLCFFFFSHLLFFSFYLPPQKYIHKNRF